MAKETKTKLESELTSALDNVQPLSTDLKEYTIAVGNISKLHQMIVNESNLEESIKRNTFDRTCRKKQLNIDLKKAENENLKLQNDIIKESNRHEEEMLKLSIQEKLTEKEIKTIEINQKKQEEMFKKEKRRDLAIFGVKLAGIATTVVLSFILACNELHFERQENGIVPNKVTKLDAVIQKTGELFIK